MSSRAKFLSRSASNSKVTMDLSLRPVRRRSRFVLVAVAAVGASVQLSHAQNLITNGTFEGGNVGFASDYGYSSAGNCCEGQYTVRNNGSSFNGSFVNPPPSSPGSNLMMVVNGSTVPNLRIWYQTVAVTPGRTYALALRGCTAVAGGPAIVQWQINGSLIGSSVTLPAVTRQWTDLLATWTAPAGVGSIVLAVRDLNTATFPNDFYLDDLAMTAVVPTITSPPTAASACIGGAATFSITATGASPLIYQWRRGGQTISALSNPSAATATLLLNSVQLADAGVYDCLVTDAGNGTATSPGASLTVTNCACSLADIAGGGTDGRSPDGIVDGSDFIAFINSFSTGDPAIDPLADVAGGGANGELPDGIIDGNDFVAFINAFAAGC